MTTVDTSAVRLVQRVASKLATRGCKMVMANWRGIDVAGMQVMAALDFNKTISEQHFSYEADRSYAYQLTHPHFRSRQNSSRRAWRRRVSPSVTRSASPSVKAGQSRTRTRSRRRLLK